MDKHLIEQASSIVDYFAMYHRHKVVGLEHIPESGGGIIAVNHSLATYDIALLNNSIFKSTKRIPRPLMDRWFFKFEQVAKLMSAVGAVEGKPNDARNLLEQGEIVCVAPGGMMESLRPSTERYQIMWERRKGFVKLAIELQVPIILAACPKADDIFDVYTTPITNWLYEHYKIPFALLRGIGLSPVPKPIQLVHVIGKPMQPPKVSGPISDAVVNKFHREVTKHMRELMGRALTQPLFEDDE